MAEKASPAVVKQVLFTALDALRDYLSDLVIVGGWVPQIHAWKEEIPEIPVRSYDVDAAVARKVPVRGQKGIVAALEGADFEKIVKDSSFGLAAFGQKKLPITQFYYHKGRIEIPVEFITPLLGSGEESSVMIQGGLVAPALRYTEIVLNNTETVSLIGETVGAEKKQFTFKVPTLSAFVFAKGLIFARRGNSDKKEKDLAYIFAVLDRPSWRKAVVDGFPELVAKHPAGWYRTFKRQLGEAFSTEGSTGPAWVARQYPQRGAAEMRREAFRTFQDFLRDLG